jgi:hypothetical protein
MEDKSLGMTCTMEYTGDIADFEAEVGAHFNTCIVLLFKPELGTATEGG